MSYVLTNIGEEYFLKNGLEGSTIIVGLYNDTTDALGETDDLSALTSEPSGGSYARQSNSLTTANVSGDWAARISSDAVFDVTGTSADVDSYFLVANFDSTEAGDGGTATDHLIVTGALSQLRDLSQIDQLTVAAESAGVSLS